MYFSITQGLFSENCYKIQQWHARMKEKMVDLNFVQKFKKYHPSLKKGLRSRI